MSKDSSSPALPHRRFSPSPNREADAGLRASQHYKRRLPSWRYRLRESLLPLVRSETPYLAHIQNTCRSPWLDSYFAITANLGTHTFYMTFLPVCFWCGFPEFGVALVHMLGLGVCITGAIKDLVGLPRPLSPPLQRITMSGSAALEYGFPSTHTTNAISVAIYGLHGLYASRSSWSPTVFYLLCTLCGFYAVSIAAGRLYCGMHGFFDIVFGAVLGALIAWIRLAVGSVFDMWIISGSWVRPVVTVTILGLAVRFHPEPADNCPCFDDSVAFIGAMMGVELGTWRWAEYLWFTEQPRSLAAMYPYSNRDVLKSSARLVGGIATIFVWRATAKPLLLKALPPIYRAIDHIGLRIPRRYFLQATDYSKVPPLGRDDNVLPSATELPAFISSIRHPKRRRVSVGPQSEADARELIALRRQQRRESRASSHPRAATKTDINPVYNGARIGNISANGDNLHNDDIRKSLLSPRDIKTQTTETQDNADEDDDAETEDEKEMLANLQKPRTHYDAEVVTKLVVYTGIALLVTEGNPIWFAKLGLA